MIYIPIVIFFLLALILLGALAWVIANSIDFWEGR